jgi:SAM-dependent methyltransferase
MQSNEYVHGYSSRENQRLNDQAATLAELLHHDTIYPSGSLVLEAGCGVGAQTVILAQNNPQAKILSVDISEESLKTAQERIHAAGFENVTFQQADIFNLSFEAETFDHVFVCFVLEHLSNPNEALLRLKHVLKTGGSLTAIEGDHGSTFFHPDNENAHKCIQCLIDIQSQAGGDALIGRKLYPLLIQAGLRDVHISPRMVYVDGSRPYFIEGFTLNTFTAMVEGVREKALQKGLVNVQTWEAGINALRRTAEKDGVFCYTFFKAVGKK